MRAGMRRIAKHRIAAALIAAVVGAVATAGCTDPIPQHAGSQPSLAPPVEQDLDEAQLGSGRAGSRAIRLSDGAVAEIEDIAEVFCTMRIDVVPAEGECHTSPRIGADHRQSSRAPDLLPPHRHIPSESDSGILVSIN